MHITLVGACELKHGYGGAAKALERLGHTISFIPAITFKMEDPNKHPINVLAALKEQDPDVVLWWRAETLSANELALIKSYVKKPFLMYSWDDPLQWELHKEMPEKCKIIDYAFSCCMDSVDKYKKQKNEPIY